VNTKRKSADCAKWSASPKLYPHFKNHKKQSLCNEQQSGSAENKNWERIQSVKEQKADSWKK
jgi:hypothetical protein